MRVKFLRGPQPGKINIKVIWGSSSSQQDLLLSNSNSLASMNDFQVVGGSAVSREKPSGKGSGGRGAHGLWEGSSSAPVVVEDVNEVVNSSQAVNLSSKMHEMKSRSIERKAVQLPSTSTQGAKLA